MKILIMALGMMIVSAAVKADTRSLVCSNAAGNIRRVEYSTEVKANASLEKAQILVKTVTLAGPQEITLQVKDLNLTSSGRTVIESYTQKTDTFCGVSQKTVFTNYVERIAFSKKDGSNIINDDTPQSSPSALAETVLCKETLTDSWPCK